MWQKILQARKGYIGTVEDVILIILEVVQEARGFETFLISKTFFLLNEIFHRVLACHIDIRNRVTFAVIWGRVYSTLLIDSLYSLPPNS